ncbi:hypothetical protein PR048_015222 [Dryococelus australis]|uniref:Uncharacterized protein n=1 Tax=Dryococelus australis TaxID=614101 RepID=A0ABQ9HGC9_9NEOP|nr:hypothetical protein PR048_015222 [Dryococelus australis]
MYYRNILSFVCGGAAVLGLVSVVPLYLNQTPSALDVMFLVIMIKMVFSGFESSYKEIDEDSNTEPQMVDSSTTVQALSSRSFVVT